MIQPQTLLNVADNSGVKVLRCIKVLGGSKKQYGVVGDLIRGSVQKFKQKESKKAGLKKGDMVFALIVQTRFPWRRRDGQSLRIFRNSAVIVDKIGKPLASRILIPLPCEFKQKRNTKLVNLARSIL